MEGEKSDRGRDQLIPVWYLQERQPWCACDLQDAHFYFWNLKNLESPVFTSQTMNKDNGKWAIKNIRFVWADIDHRWSVWNKMIKASSCTAAQHHQHAYLLALRLSFCIHTWGICVCTYSSQCMCERGCWFVRPLPVWTCQAAPSRTWVGPPWESGQNIPDCLPQQIAVMSDGFAHAEQKAERQQDEECTSETMWHLGTFPQGCAEVSVGVAVWICVLESILCETVRILISNSLNHRWLSQAVCPSQAKSTHEHRKGL